MLDSIDEQLIHLLSEDARQSSQALARRLRVSASTVRRRIRKLVKGGTLRTTAVVDPGSIGFHSITVIGFDVAYDKLDSVVQMLTRWPEIQWVSTTTGRFDILAMARFRSTEDLSQFVQKALTKIEGLRDSETFICLQVSKNRYIRV